MTIANKVALIGAPTDVGAGHRGASMAPEALRVAGLAESLRQLNLTVEDYGNLVGPGNPNLPRDGDYRHLREVTEWCLLVREAVSQAFLDDALPVVMGGDHSLAIGSIAAAARHCQRTGRSLSVLWLDAHSDFNTPASSPTGNLHGMPVAVVAGYGPSQLTELYERVPMISADRIVQVGVRSVDRVEKHLVLQQGLVVYDMRQVDELRMRAVMERALDHAVRRDSHLHVSFDVDFLDPVIAPGVPTTVAGGPTYREAQLCMEMIHDTGLMASLDIMELNPAYDDGNRTARLIVELVKSLFGEQILARVSEPGPRNE